jgi:hypothetical protein
MQMKNIFEKYETTRNYFNENLLNYITHSLFDYLYYNLEDENYNLFRWEFKTALTINANGEYIY